MSPFLFFRHWTRLHFGFCILFFTAEMSLPWKGNYTLSIQGRNSSRKLEFFVLMDTQWMNGHMKMSSHTLCVWYIRHMFPWLCAHVCVGTDPHGSHRSMQAGPWTPTFIFCGGISHRTSKFIILQVSSGDLLVSYLSTWDYRCPHCALLKHGYWESELRSSRLNHLSTPYS